MNTNRIETLDSLRGIASMVVVIFHCLLSFTIFYEANYDYKFSNWIVGLFTVSPLHTLWAGKEAVLLFFVLSGFVLMIPFTNNKPPKYLSYTIKRICRIYIPYAVIMFISVVLAFFFWKYNNLEGMSSTYQNRWDHEISLKSIIKYITMTNYDTANVNGVVWTLFIELKVSLYLPIFMLILSKFNLKNGTFFSLTLNTLLLILFIFGVQNLFFIPVRNFILFFSDTFYYNYFFIFGSVLAKQRHTLKKYEGLNIYWKYLLLVLALFLINSRWVSFITNFKTEYIENLVTVLGFGLLFIVLLSTKSIDQFLNKKTFLYLGKISFSLYLIHIPVLMLTTVFLSNYIPVWLSFCLVPIFCIPVAHFSYKFVEEPSMKLGKKLAKKVNNRNINKAA